MKKIVMVGKFPPHIGGVASHVHNLSVELKKKGNDVYVLTYPHDKIRDIDDIKVFSAPTLNIKGLRGLIFIFTSAVKLIRIIRNYEIDIIHAHYIIPPALSSFIASKVTGKPYYVTVHGSDVMILSSNPILRPVFRKILNNAKKVIVVTEALRDRLLRVGIDRDKIDVIYNSVDTSRFNPHVKSSFREEAGIRKNEKLILFVGNLVPQKGVEYLIKAKYLMKNPAKLVITGGGPLYDKLKSMADTGEGDIIFTGPRTDVSNLMKAADVVVLPSISEGLPMVILEAMAMGKPIVATKVGGIPAVVDENVGILVNPESPSELASALDQLLEDDRKRKKLGENGLRRALEFSKIKIPY